MYVHTESPVVQWYGRYSIGEICNKEPVPIKFEYPPKTLFQLGVFCRPSWYALFANRLSRSCLK